MTTIHFYLKDGSVAMWGTQEIDAPAFEHIALEVSDTDLATLQSGKTCHIIDGSLTFRALPFDYAAYQRDQIASTPPIVTPQVAIDPQDYVAVPIVPIRMIPLAVKRGLPLIGTATETLTTQEQEDQRAAENWQLKEILRQKIETGVGDTLDQVANTDKQIQLITGLVVRMYRAQRLALGKLVDNETLTQAELDAILPEDLKAGYDSYADNYAAAVDAGQYRDRVDVDDPTTLIPRLMAANAVIGQLVKTEYLDKQV